MKGKNVVITGATKGIGRAVVDELAACGHSLYICARTKHDVDNLVDELGKKYPDQSFYGDQVDISDKSQIKDFATGVKSVWEKVDVLVNNAGIFLPGTILGEEDDMLEKQLNTNLISAYALTRHLGPLMVQQGYGDIINMCSVAGIKAYVNGGSYCISKFAMRGMSMVLREELKETGVRVTTILPGATWSESWSGIELPPERLMPASSIAGAVKMAIDLDRSAVLEEIILRPQLGDL